MTVQTDFEVKQFIAYTHLKGGVLEILNADMTGYLVRYQNDQYNITIDALQKIKLLNQDLVIVNRILL